MRRMSGHRQGVQCREVPHAATPNRKDNPCCEKESILKPATPNRKDNPCCEKESILKPATPQPPLSCANSPLYREQWPCFRLPADVPSCQRPPSLRNPLCTAPILGAMSSLCRLYQSRVSQSTQTEVLLCYLHNSRQHPYETPTVRDTPLSRPPYKIMLQNSLRNPTAVLQSHSPADGSFPL